MVFGPIRQVRENPISVTGRVSSIKLESMVQAESLLETDFIRILDFDPRVQKYGVQVARLPWKGPKGRTRHYCPDVLVKFNNLMLENFDRPLATPAEKFWPTVYEVKPWAVLKADWAELKPRFVGAKQTLDKMGIKFKVITERQMHPMFLHNVRKLVELKKLCHPAWVSMADSEASNRISEMVHDAGKVTTPQQILDDLGIKDNSSLELRMRIIRATWTLVALCGLDADLTEPLSLSTPLWPGQMYHPEKAASTPKWRQPPYDWYR